MIRVKKIANNHGQSRTGYATVTQGAVTIRDMAQQIEKSTGVPRIEAMTVLKEFATLATEAMKEGKIVQIEGFLNMYITARMDAAGTPHPASINAIMTQAFKAEIKDIQVEVIK